MSIVIHSNLNCHVEESDNLPLSVIEEVNSLVLNTSHRRALEVKFGVDLGNFMCDYFTSNYPNLAEKGFQFLLNRTSCWRYKDIGVNWQAKRFLCDTNYIFEKAGIPRLTHIDRGVNPKAVLIRQSNLIPATDKKITRNIVKYTIDDVKLEGTSKKCKREYNKLKSIIEGRAVRKSRSFYKFQKAHLSEVSKTNDVCLNVSKPADSYKPLSNNYLEALKKPIDKEKFRKLAQKLSNNNLKLMKKKLVNKNEVNGTIKLAEKLVGDLKRDGYLTNTSHVRFFPKNPQKFEVGLSNFYEVLKNYKDETELEEIEPLTKDDVHTAAQLCLPLLDKISCKKFKRLIFSVLGVSKSSKLLLKQVGIESNVFFKDLILSVNPKQFLDKFLKENLYFEEYKCRKVKLDNFYLRKSKNTSQLRRSLRRSRCIGIKRKANFPVKKCTEKKIKLMKTRAVVSTKKLNKLRIKYSIEKHNRRIIEERELAEKIAKDKRDNILMIAELKQKEKEAAANKKLAAIREKSAANEIQEWKKYQKENSVRITKDNDQYFHNGVPLCFPRSSYEGEIPDENSSNMTFYKTRELDFPFFYQFRYHVDRDHHINIEDFVNIKSLSCSFSHIPFIKLKRID